MLTQTYPCKGSASSAISVSHYLGLISIFLLALVLLAGPLKAQTPSADNALIRSTSSSEYKGTKGLLKNITPGLIGPGGGQIGVLAIGPNADTISTVPPFIPGNGQSGVTLEFIANQPVDITGMATWYNSGVTTGNVWIRTGGVAGPPTIDAANGWTQVVTGGTVTGANGAGVVYLDFGAVKISLAANTRIGIFIEGGLSYMNGGPGDQVIFTDGVGTVDVSDYASYGGTVPNPSFNPRRFCGAVVYELAVSGACTPFTNFAINNITGTTANVSWTPGAGNSSFYMEYGVTGFTPGTGTTVTGLYPGLQPPTMLSGLTPNTTYDVYFGEICNSGNDTAKFPSPQSFTTTSLCPPPLNFMASNITSTSVDLSWTHAGGAGAFSVISGPPGFDPATAGTSVLATSSPHTLTGLSPATSYDVFVVAACGIPNGNSDTIGPISITTTFASPQPLVCSTGNPSTVFFEEFSATTTGWTGDIGTGTSTQLWNFRTGGTTSGSTGPNGAHSGTHYVYYEGSGTSSATAKSLVSPAIDLSAVVSDAELSFWLHAYGATVGTLTVGVGTSAAGPFTPLFTNTGQIQSANADAWVNIGADLSPYIGQTVFLEFLYLTGSGFTSDVAVDLVEVYGCVNCAAPSSLLETSLTPNGVDLGWTENGSATSWQVSYGASGITPSTGTQVVTATNPHSIAGLTPNTSYDWYVRAICGAGDTSNWVGPKNFVTPCAPLMAPYTQDFETGFAPGDFGPDINACFSSINTGQSRWEVEDATGTNENSTNTGPFYDRTMFGTPGGIYLYLETSGSANTSDTLTSDQIDVSGLTTPYFGFSYHMFGATMGTLTVELWDGNVWAPITSIVGQQQTAGGDPWTDFAANLGPLASNIIQLRFIGIRGTNLTSDMAIDEVFVIEAPACVPSSSLMSSNVTSNSADLAWTAGGGSTFNIEYGLSGFTPGGGGTLVTGVSNPHTLSGLAPNTSYDFYVQDDCGASGTSSFVGPSIFTTACAPVVAPYFQDFESGFTPGNVGPAINPCFNAINTSNSRWEVENSTGGNENSSGTGPFFDKTLGNVSGGHYLFLETSGTTNTSDTLTSDQIDISGLTNPYLGFSYHMYGVDMGSLEVEVWDGAAWVNVTTIAGQQQTAGGDPWLDFAGLLPSLSTSIIQVRFIGIRGANFTSDMSVDDMFIIEAPACPESSGLTASSVTQTSANLSWTPGSGTSFNLEYGPTGFTPGTGTMVSGIGNPYNILGLNSFTGYDYYVTDDCGAGGLSTQVGPYTFMTLAPSVSLPYNEDFEAGNGNWAADNSASGTWAYGTPANTIINAAASGVSAWVTNLTGQYNAGELSSVTSPPVDISSATGKEIFRASIWWNAEFSWDGTQVLYSTDGGASWIVLGAVGDPNNWYNDGTISGLPAGQQVGWTGRNSTSNGSGGWLTAKHELDSATLVNNASIMFRFLFGADGSGQDEGFAFDDVFVGVESCPNPTALAVSNVSSTSADLSWTPGGAGSTSNLEYGPAGFTPGSGTTVTGATSPYMLTGLTPVTVYEFYVQDDCGSSTSTLSGPVSFATAIQGPSGVTCSNGTPGFLLSDEFDDPNAWTGDIGTNNGFWRFNSGGTTSGSTGPSAAHSGSNYIYFESSTGGLDTASIFSAPIDLSCAAEAAELSFWLHAYGANMGVLDVRVATNPGGPFTTVFNYPGGTLQTINGDPWQQVGVDLTAYLGQSIYLEFRFSRLGTGFNADLAIDLVQVESCISCPLPTMPMVSNVGTTTADISWQGGSSTAWQIEYGPAGFAQGAGTTMNVTTSSVSLTNLMLGTAYEYYVRTDCGSSTYSCWVGPVAFATSLCDSVDRCEFYFDLEDGFGDGWNGALVTVYQAGIPVAVLGGNFGNGSSYGPDTLLLCDSLPSMVVLTTGGGFPSEVGVTVRNPLGVPLGEHLPTSGTSQGDTLFMFNSSCTYCPQDSTYQQAQICDDDSLWAQGAWQNTTGLYVDSLVNQLGCDSLVYTDLMVYPTYDLMTSSSICDGDSMMINGNYETMAGIYSMTFATAAGCDSTYTVDLSVDPTYDLMTSASICDGDSMMINGSYESMAGMYSMTYATAAGCDSTYTVDLMVNPSYSISSSSSICDGDSALINGNYEKIAGMYAMTFMSLEGCDSIYTVSLNVDSSFSTMTSASICDGDSLLINGSFETTSGIYSNTYTAQGGCDSTYTVDLMVNPTYDIMTSASICDGDSMMINGSYETMAGMYSMTYATAAGCDSTYTVDLMVNPTYDIMTNASICDGDSMMINGSYETIAGIYSMTYATAAACDSTYSVDLNLLPSSDDTVMVSTCPGDSVFVGGAWQTMAGAYVDMYMNAQGCDSVVTTMLSLDSAGCTYDCIGDLNGTAYIDGCGSCVGGNTGLLPCVPGCTPNQVKSISLIDASNATVVKALANGDTIDKRVLSMFSVTADTCGSLFGSILFTVNGVPFTIENVWPYAIKGDNYPKSYHAWNPIVGTYLITATPYSMNNTGGTMGTPLSVTVYVTDSVPSLDCNGDLGGTAYLDTCGVCVGGTTGKTACVTGCTTLEVVSFDLVSTMTGHAMRPLNDGDTIYLGSIGGFSIRAKTCDVTVGSVLFDLNGSFFKKENIYPYDIMGGSFSSPVAFMPPLGTHTVVATPYTSMNGNGMSGISETATFHVVAGMAPRTDNPNGSDPVDPAGLEGAMGNNGLDVSLIQLRVFPNPTVGVATISLENANTDQPVLITDVSGKVIATLYPSNIKQGQQLYDLDLSHAPKGIYLIRVSTGEEMITRRLIVN